MTQYLFLEEEIRHNYIQYTVHSSAVLSFQGKEACIEPEGMPEPNNMTISYQRNIFRVKK